MSKPCDFSKQMTHTHTPLNSMFGTITFSQMPVSVLVSANSCLYAGLSATDARNWIALLTICNTTQSSIVTYYYFSLYRINLNKQILDPQSAATQINLCPSQPHHGLYLHNVLSGNDSLFSVASITYYLLLIYLPRRDGKLSWPEHRECK